MPRFGVRCYLTLSNEIQNHLPAGICIPLSLVNSHPLRIGPGAGPGREAAKLTLDGEDRFGIMRGEGKGHVPHDRSTRGRMPPPFRGGSLSSSRILLRYCRNPDMRTLHWSRRTR